MNETQHRMPGTCDDSGFRSWIPTTTDAVGVRLVFWLGATSLPILAWAGQWALRDFNPEKAYEGSRIAYAMGPRALLTVLFVLMTTSTTLLISKRARQIRSFYALLVAAFVVLFLWFPML